MLFDEVKENTEVEKYTTQAALIENDSKSIFQKAVNLKALVSMVAIGKSTICILFACCLLVGGKSDFTKSDFTKFDENKLAWSKLVENANDSRSFSPSFGRSTNRTNSRSDISSATFRQSAFARVSQPSPTRFATTRPTKLPTILQPPKPQRGYQYGYGGRRGRSTEIYDFNEMDRFGVPDWEINNKFKYDEFRFVRVKYRSIGYSRFGAKWRIDYPDSDLNFSFRLQQLTSLKVNPDPIVLELTDEKILDYPFMYLIEPGDIALTDEEVLGMRRYLNNGGFIMVDDFWSDYEWYALEEQMKKVLPGKRYVELDLDHPIFSCVYDLKTKPQCPAIGNYERTGYTTDRPGDPSARDVHYRAYFDDNDRMCMIACHNTDLGDGWEREGESEFYFKRFSEKEAYPMGINIVVYAMTH